MAAPVLLTWYACDLRSGLILEELRSLAPAGAFGCKLGASTTANFDLDLGGAPASWVEATQPGRSMLVGVDDLTQVPIWAGFVLTRVRGSANTVSLGCATPEAYMDRRYTGDVSYPVATDAATILIDLGSGLVTVPCPQFVFDAPATGINLAYTVDDTDDRTILSTWQELMGQQGGPEWTIIPGWLDDTHQIIQLTISIRPKVGYQSTSPEAVFDLPGCIADYQQTESYEAGKGANEVMAWGDGQGASRLKSAVHLDADALNAGWVPWVYRFTPASGLTDPTQLDAHAAEALAQLQDGTSTWAVNAVASRAPRVGSDWGLGDSVRATIAAGRSPGHPDGADVVARAYAWQLDPAADRITPILVEE